jgi:hypothetical protein
VSKEVESGLTLWLKQKEPGKEHRQQLKVIKQLREELDGEHPFVIETDDDYEFLAKLLVHSQKNLKDTKKKKEAVTKPINQALRAFRSWWQPPIHGWEQVIKLIKGKLAEYEERLIREKESAAKVLAEAAQEEDFELAHAVSAKLHEEVPTVAGVSSREVWVVDKERVDLKQAPVEYLALDSESVNEYLRRWAKEKERPPDLPGIPFKLEVRLRAG